MKQTMKLTGILLLFLFLAGQGWAQNNTAAKATAPEKAAKQTACKFVDKDKDGVCDNYQAKGTAKSCCNFTDKNGDGVCDNRGAKQGTGCCGKGKMQGKGECPMNQNGKKCSTPCSQKCASDPGKK